MKKKEYVCSDFTIDVNNLEKVSSQMLKEGEFDKLSSFFKAISDKTRIKILFSLSKSTLCVCEIAELLNMSVSAISHQLRVLRMAHLVKFEKKGKVVYYSLDDHHVNIVFNNALEHIQE